MHGQTGRSFKQLQAAFEFGAGFGRVDVVLVIRHAMGVQVACQGVLVPIEHRRDAQGVLRAARNHAQATAKFILLATHAGEPHIGLEFIEGALKGFEVNYQQPFTFLPGVWRNFGTLLNYTYVKSRIQYAVSPTSAVTITDDLLNLSPKAWNATLGLLRCA